jgi:hypothetical protein
MSYAKISKRGAKPAAERRAAGGYTSAALFLGSPNDAFEREADRVANAAMAGEKLKRHWSISTMGPAALLQRKCACGSSGECADCKGKEENTSGKSLQRKPAGPSESKAAPPIVHDVLKSPGRSLDKEARHFFEKGFGHDFSKVRIHNDARAAESARAVGALAYTVGRDLVFAAGQYAPSQAAGRRLLAHELTHVLQQGGNSRAPGHSKLEIGPTNGIVEDEAEHGSSATVRGAPFKPRLSHPVQLSRRPANPYEDSGNAELREQADDAIRESEFRRAGRIEPPPGPGSAVFSAGHLTVSKKAFSQTCNAFTDPVAPTPAGSYCIRRQGEAQRWGGVKGTFGRLGGVFAETAVRQDRSRWYLLEPQFLTTRSKLQLHFGTRSAGCVTVTDADCFKKIEDLLNLPGTTTKTGYDGYPPDNSDGVKNDKHAVECVAVLEVK